MTSPLNSTSSSRAISAKPNPFHALANAIERNPFWVDSLGEWELPPEENRRLRTPAETARKRKPTLASVAKQASKAGIEVARYEVKPDGTVVIVTGAPGAADTVDVNPWDEVLIDAADQKRPS